MIQAQFSQQYPSGGGGISKVGSFGGTGNSDVRAIRFVNQHKKNGRFTESIIHHGSIQRDTTITAATRSLERQKKEKKHRFDSMDKLMSEFKDEVLEVRKVQQKLIAQQKGMALCAKEYFAARTIQQAILRWLSAWRLKLLKKQRLIKERMMFLWECRRRDTAARLIAQRGRLFLVRNRFLHLYCQSQLVRRIQRCYAKFLYRRRLRTRGVVLKQTLGVVRLVTLFGTARATRHFRELQQQLIYRRNIARIERSIFKHRVVQLEALRQQRADEKAAAAAELAAAQARMPRRRPKRQQQVSEEVAPAEEDELPDQPEPVIITDKMVRVMKKFVEAVRKRLRRRMLSSEAAKWAFFILSHIDSDTGETDGLATLQVADQFSDGAAEFDHISGGSKGTKMKSTPASNRVIMFLTAAVKSAQEANLARYAMHKVDQGADTDQNSIAISNQESQSMCSHSSDAGSDSTMQSKSVSSYSHHRSGSEIEKHQKQSQPHVARASGKGSGESKSPQVEKPRISNLRNGANYNGGSGDDGGGGGSTQTSAAYKLQSQAGTGAGQSSVLSSTVISRFARRPGNRKKAKPFFCPTVQESTDPLTVRDLPRGLCTGAVAPRSVLEATLIYLELRRAALRRPALVDGRHPAVAAASTDAEVGGGLGQHISAPGAGARGNLANAVRLASTRFRRGRESTTNGSGNGGGSSAHLQLPPALNLKMAKAIRQRACADEEEDGDDDDDDDDLNSSTTSIRSLSGSRSPSHFLRVSTTPSPGPLGMLSNSSGGEDSPSHRRHDWSKERGKIKVNRRNGGGNVSPSQRQHQRQHQRSNSNGGPSHVQELRPRVSGTSRTSGAGFASSADSDTDYEHGGSTMEMSGATNGGRGSSSSSSQQVAESKSKGKVKGKGRIIADSIDATTGAAATVDLTAPTSASNEIAVASESSSVGAYTTVFSSTSLQASVASSAVVPQLTEWTAGGNCPQPESSGTSRDGGPSALTPKPPSASMSSEQSSTAGIRRSLLVKRIKQPSSEKIKQPPSAPSFPIAEERHGGIPQESSSTLNKAAAQGSASSDESDTISTVAEEEEAEEVVAATTRRNTPSSSHAPASAPAAQEHHHKPRRHSGRRRYSRGGARSTGHSEGSGGQVEQKGQDKVGVGKQGVSSGKLVEAEAGGASGVRSVESAMKRRRSRPKTVEQDQGDNAAADNTDVTAVADHDAHKL